MEEARRQLRESIDRLRGEVLRRHRGYERPDPSKLIREGLAIGARCVEDARGDTEAEYLAEVARLLAGARETQASHNLSDDGYQDEDGYILAGIADVRREVERLTARTRPPLPGA